MNDASWKIEEIRHALDYLEDEIGDGTADSRLREISEIIGDLLRKIKMEWYDPDKHGTLEDVLLRLEGEING